MVRLSRACRVGLLLFAVVAMSVVDLLITLEFLTSVGMAEANPVARLVISTNSPVAITVWKGLTVASAALILWRLRERPVAELAAWFACLALAAVTVRWLQYTEITDEWGCMLAMAEDDITHDWVRLR
ncbi:MAG: DUF5658 family protein [Planctomycetota bacterium]